MSRWVRRHAIVNFHGIGVPHDDVPSDEVPYWVSEERFNEILDRIAVLRARGHGIRITFDDGNRSDVSIAAPALVERGMTADFFVLAGRLGVDGYLREEDLGSLRSMGMGVGTHGADHVDWRFAEASKLRAEIVGARDRIAEAISEPVDMVSVPFGAYDPHVLSALQSAGYSEIHTSDGGTALLGARVLPRTSIRSDMDDALVERVLTGSEPIASRVRRGLSTSWRSHVAGTGEIVLPAAARSIWTRLMLRGVAFSGRYGRLRRIYAVEDPWEMSSDLEQCRFARTNEMLATIQSHYGSILELGSGEGHQSTYLAGLTEDLRGLEISERAVARARGRCPQASFRVGSAEEVLAVWPDSRFDLVVACEVLYYVDRLQDVKADLEAMADRVFVSNYLPRSREIRECFQGPGWRTMEDISCDGTVWECFIWESEAVRSQD